jgi:fumarate reductase subunit C
VQQPTNVPVYTEYHPRWYRPRVSVYWWLGQWRYLKFILRELSSVFVAFVVIMTILQVRALRGGPQAYARFQHQMQSPAVISVSLISLFFVVFHTITWFNLTPRAMAVRVRGKRIPESLVAAPNYAIWIVVSTAVTLLVLRGR